ncbi:hypothetical protein Anas_01698, partial [Armadillidium nasatum]
ISEMQIDKLETKCGKYERNISWKNLIVLTMLSAGEISRVRREENRGCCSPVGVSGVTPITSREAQSPSSSGVAEPISTSLRGSPDAPVEGTPIKTEIPGGLLTPMTTAEGNSEEQRNSGEGSISGGRGSSSPTSTPTNCTNQSRSNTTVSTPTLPSSNVESSPILIRPEKSAVGELEATITRHLSDEASNFSTDALLRGTSGIGTAGHRSTIQWVGGTGGQQSSLSSPLFRPLYVNRESVIRTSVQRSYYPEVQAALPTPPGQDGYQEAMFAKNHEFYNGTTSNSSSNSAGGVGMSSTPYTDYHTAMTPPSSVSPREKLSSDCGELRGPTSYINDTGGSLPAQPLPLKPQVYSYGPPSVSLEAPSYSSSLTDQASSLYSHAGFHLYHSNSSKSSSGPYDPLRTGTSWYSPSS